MSAIALLFIAAFSAPLPARADEVAKAKQADAASPAASAADKESKRRDTIRYGIDSEILDLVKSLGADKDASLNEDLAELLGRTRSPKLRVALLDFFAGLEWKGVEPQALKLVEGRDLLDSASVSSALLYLATIRSKDALAFSATIIKEDDKKLLPALIRLMGRSGGKDEEELLLGWFEGDSATEALRQEAIRALGEIGSTKAAEKLAAIVKDPAKSKGDRMTACDALGKIKDSSTVPSLIEAANGDDANVRENAVGALASFSDEASASAIVEALRDSDVKARINACKGIATRRIASADPFLRYKAANDPAAAVKTEALKALAALGGESFAFLREKMVDKKLDNQTRALCFNLLMRKDAPQSMGALKTELAAQATEKERSLYTAYLRELANAIDAPDASPLAAIALSDKDPNMRIAAVEWARKNKVASFKTDLERLKADDPSEMIRKRATEALASY